MATLPTSQIDPSLPFQDPAVLAWLRQSVLGIPQAGNTSPIMERLMQTTADPPAGLSDLPSRFYNPNYTPRQSAPSRINYNPMGFPEEASLQGGGGDETLAGGTRSRYQMTARDVEAINNTSARLGIDPQDLTAVIAYETIGTMNPDIIGGKGNNYQGLIQFGKNERRAYGYQRGMSFAEQVEGPVYRYLADRGVEPGMDVGRIYRTVNGGNPNAKLTKNDGNGTIAQHIARIKSDFLPRAQQMLQAAPAGPDVNAIMDVASRNFAPSAVETPPPAASGFAPSLGGIGGTPAQAAIADLVGQPAPDLTPEQIDFLTMTDEAGNYLNQPPQPQSAPTPPSLPPEWASAAGFPIDEALTGRSGQDVLNGGPRMDPRRAGPATGPIPADMGAMLSPADVLNAGPQLNPRNAIGSAPVGPTTDQGVLAMGPNMRPENRWMAGAGGAPDASMVPSPNPRGTPFAPSFPSLFGEQPPELMGGMSAAMGGPPSLAGNMSAAMGNARPPNMTPASQPISIDPSFGVGYRVQRDADRMATEQDARMAQFAGGMESDRLAAELEMRRREMEPFTPAYRAPPTQPMGERFDMTAGQRSNAGQMFALPSLDGAFPGPDPINGTVAAGSTGGEFFSPAPPMPQQAPNAMAGRFDDAFAPSSPGMIADLQGVYNSRQQQPPTMTAQDGIEGGFGPTPAQATPPNLAIPFNEVPGFNMGRFDDAVGATPGTPPPTLPAPPPPPPPSVASPPSGYPDIYRETIDIRARNNLDAPPSLNMDMGLGTQPASAATIASPLSQPMAPPPSIGMGDFNERFGGSVVQPVSAPMPTAGAMDIRPPAQSGVMPSMPDPLASQPAAAPPQTQTEMQRKSTPSMFQGPMGGLLHAVAPKLFPNAGQGIGGGLAGPAGGLLGFLASKNPPSFTAGGAGGVAPSSSGGTANWQHGTVGNNPGMRYTTSNGVTVTTMTDPFTGATYTGYG